MDLPAEVRKAADNDPQKFLAIVESQQAEIKRQERESAKLMKEAAGKDSSVDPAQAIDADKTPE